jgi:hypothetical protein
MPFLALDLSLDLIRGLRPTIELLRSKSPRLRRQLEDSLAGIVQNVCEGSGRTSGDRPQLYRIGLGPLREVNGILLAAVAFGWIAEAPMTAERDRLGAILFGLERGRALAGREPAAASQKAQSGRPCAR